MKKIWKTYGLICDKLTNILLWFAGISLISMLCIVVFDIAYRILIGGSLISSLELAGYALAFITFAGLAWTFQENGFIRVGLLYDRFSVKLKLYIDIFLHLTALFYTCILTKHLWAFVIFTKVNNVTSLDKMHTPLWIPRLVIAIGASVFVFILVYDVIRCFVRIFDQSGESGPQLAGKNPEL